MLLLLCETCYMVQVSEVNRLKSIAIASEIAYFPLTTLMRWSLSGLRIHIKNSFIITAMSLRKRYSVSIPWRALFAIISALLYKILRFVSHLFLCVEWNSIKCHTQILTGCHCYTDRRIDRNNIKPWLILQVHLWTENLIYFIRFNL